jgi:hypothetical protein
MRCDVIGWINDAERDNARRADRRRPGVWQMITLFSTPKPFVGHVGIIQCNAIRSWQRLHPDVEIILIGDDSGTGEVCAELGIRHIETVKKNRYGTKYLASVYDQAQEVARHDILAHVNCDIMLMADFRQAVDRVRILGNRFLMSGRRWDVDIQGSWDFHQPQWEDTLRGLALDANRQRPAQWIDYFVFPKGLYYHQIPEFVIGRPGWDVWLLWYALSSGEPLVDASSLVRAVHQNHDYSYHPDGEKGVWEGEEAQENYRLLANNRKFRTLEDATFLLEARGLRRNRRLWVVRAKRLSLQWVGKVWIRLLDISRPLRHKIGLRQRTKT